MANPTNLAPLRSAFDTLLQAPRRPSIGRPWLPIVVIAILVALIAGLFTAIVIEEQTLKREALQRDLESASQQLGARISSLAETLSSAAVEIGSGTLGERRFASLAHELAAAKPEVQRIKRVSAAGRVLWQPVSPAVGAPLPDTLIDPALQPLLARAAAGNEPVFGLLSASATAGAAVAVVVPIHSDRQFTGALVARASLRDLLRTGLPPAVLERYRLSVLNQGELQASSAPGAAPRSAARYATGLAPLPPSVQLQAAAFRTPTALTGSAIGWLVGALAIAVAIALATLVRYTARQARIDRALQAETSLRRAMEDSLATGLQVIDPQGVIRYVNRAFCQMTGWSESELVGRAPAFPYWPTEARAEHESRLQQILDGNAPAGGFELSVQRANDTRFEARMYVSPLLDDAGRQLGWMSSITDITEPKRARNELAAAHVRFTTVLEALQAAVSVVTQVSGARDELLFANREYVHSFGDGAAGHDRLAAALRTLDAGEVHDAARDRWFDVRTREIRWVDGRPARLQIASDITVRRATEDIARQQQEKVQFTARLMTMGEMASSLAHELNQPLTAIANYSEGALARLKSGQMTAAELIPVLEKASLQAQRAGRIIRRIREFVKRSEPRRRPTPAARVVDDAIGFAEIDASKRGIAIVATVDAALPPLLVDPILIEQVLLNLLKNAMDSMEHATVRRIEVRVGATAEPGMAQVEVIDHGSGIPAEHLASLFQPFFSTKTEGMGMGLNICRSIVEFHHGRLTVENNPAAAGGTRMRFTLPLAVAGVGDENPPPAVPGAIAGQNQESAAT